VGSLFQPRGGLDVDKPVDQRPQRLGGVAARVLDRAGERLAQQRGTLTELCIRQTHP
jgi:hypothetical protein